MSTAIALEEGRINIAQPARSQGEGRSGSRWFSLANLLPNRPSRRADRTAQRNMQRPRPISVQRSLEMPLIELPIHIHRDSFLFKSKKRHPTMSFIFDAAPAASNNGATTIDVSIWDKDERLEVVKAHAGELKQHLCFRSLTNALLGKSLEVRAECRGFQEITRLELIQSINGYIDARVHSQRVLGKLPSGSLFDYYLLDIYGQPFKVTAATGSNAGEEDEESIRSEVNRECIICLSERRDTIVLPCRHMCLCAECAEALRARADRCPMCREGNKLFLIFLMYLGCQALLEIKDQIEEVEGE